MGRTAEEIKRDVIDALTWDSRVDQSEITVEVNDGEVRLSGAVQFLNSRSIAEKLAYEVRGVRSVINRLTVRSTESIISDEEIASYVGNIFFWNSSIDATRIEVAVKDGTVVLGGTVASYWEKIKAEEFAANVMGVSRVINELSVVPSTNFRDENIARRITDNLARNLYTDAGTVTVKVDNGHVTLSGTLPTLGQKISADRVARHIEGVRSIENLITVNEEQNE